MGSQRRSAGHSGTRIIGTVVAARGGEGVEKYEDADKCYVVEGEVDQMRTKFIACMLRKA